MAQCCITLAPSVKVSASAGETGCVPSAPRDLEGTGYLVTFYYFAATVGQTDFTGADKNGNVFAGDSNSILFVNGVMLDDDCYLMNNTSFRLEEPCQTNEDIVSVIVFRAPEGTEAGQVSTLNVLTVLPGEEVVRPQNLPENLELITTQFDANWFLNDRLDEVDEKIENLDFSVDLSSYATTEWVMDQGFVHESLLGGFEAATLASANEYTDSKVAAIEIPEAADLSGYAETTYVDSADEAILNASKKFTNDSIGVIDTGADPKDLLSADQTWTGKNTYESTIQSKADTVMEMKGNVDDPKHRYFKVRGGAQLHWYAYPGSNNNTAKDCFSIEWKKDEPYPEVGLNYLNDPISSGMAVPLRYADANYAKKEDLEKIVKELEGKIGRLESRLKELEP